MRAFLRARNKALPIAIVVLGAVVLARIGPRFVEQPALAVSDGSPYTVPLVDDVNPDPDIVETTIVAQAAGVDIGTGADVSVLTFNGTIPGPEFRLKVGDTVIVHFRNEIAHATGIHWHGIELANASDGTPLTQNMVAPGDEFLYKFKVTRPGVYWYHPHHHSSTNQVFKGMYGSIIVTDPDEEALKGTVLPSAADTPTLVLADLTVCKTPGSNDAVNFDPSLPHVSGGPLPAQPDPTPTDLCEAAPDGAAIDEDGNPRGDYAAGEVPNIQKSGTGSRVNEGQTVITNGVNVGHRGGSPSAPGALAAGAQTLDVLAGQGLRLQLVNAATVRFFRLILTDASGVQVPLIRVGGQGGLLNNARLEGNASTPPPAGTFDWKYTAGEILLDPGDRADVVAIIPAGATPGQVLTMWTQDFARTGLQFAKIPTVPVAHFSVTGAGPAYTLAVNAPVRASIPGAEVEALGAPTASLLDPSAFAPPKPGMVNPEIELVATGSVLQINGVQGSHDFPGDYTAIPHEASARYAAAIGDTLELTVLNSGGAHHPFHLHGFSIQPLSFTKPGGPDYTFPYPEFRDNVDVPNGYTMTFRVRLDDRPMMDGTTMGGGVGRWVFHCHIFFHAVFGMISEFDVVAADGNERPYINADDARIEGAASDTLTMHGTYHDPDGDTPISLSASVGTITDDGDGLHWTWTHTGAVSSLVYVSATDPDGLSDQVAFALEINSPPTLILPGPQTGAYTDSLTFGISATDPDVADTLTFGAAGLPASLVLTNNGDRTATISGLLTAAPGDYPVTFSVNDGHNAPVTGVVVITITKEVTVLNYTGPVVILNGSSATMSATLNEDDGPPVIGRTVSFTLGAQACSGATNAAGVASCVIAVASVLGPTPITATFVEDAFYLGSSDSETAIVFAFPAGGAFVAGNATTANGATLNFWDAGWASANTLGIAAPNAFKGFANGVSLPTASPPATCGSGWTSSGGNSSGPPATLPAYMGMLITGSVQKDGSVVSGNTVSIVVVTPQPGYGPSPGHPGTGVIVATFCN
jgi:FtsP/CotA-like multicopper oxidase with cupredoxin domain